MGYIYLLVVVSVLGLVGMVKHQSSEIDDLTKRNKEYEEVNSGLVSKLETQNQKLKDGEDKFLKVQIELNKASDSNELLSREFDKLRGNINNRPIAKDCTSAVSELKEQVTQNAKRWNK